VLVRAAPVPVPSGLDWEVEPFDAIEEAQAYVAGVAASLAGRVPVRTAVTGGHALHEIMAAVKKFDADGIVLATHGRTGLGHLLYGSVTEALLAHSRVPVFVVRAHPGEMVAPTFDPATARVVVPLDGSTLSEAALPTALEMLGTAGELVLVSVVEPPNHVERDSTGRARAYLDQQEEATKRVAQEYLRTTAARLRAFHADLQVSWEVRVGQPAEGIVMATTNCAGDLVVMATHGRTGVLRAVTGSVAGAVVRTAFTPVLLVRASHPNGAPAPREPAVSVAH
jgi:nucleotide-binding universal stress UspA family protein